MSSLLAICCLLVACAGPANIPKGAEKHAPFSGTSEQASLILKASFIGLLDMASADQTISAEEQAFMNLMLNAACNRQDDPRQTITNIQAMQSSMTSLEGISNRNDIYFYVSDRLPVQAKVDIVAFAMIIAFIDKGVSNGEEGVAQSIRLSLDIPYSLVEKRFKQMGQQIRRNNSKPDPYTILPAGAKQGCAASFLG